MGAEAVRSGRVGASSVMASAGRSRAAQFGSFGSRGVASGAAEATADVGASTLLGAGGIMGSSKNPIHILQVL